MIRLKRKALCIAVGSTIAMLGFQGQAYAQDETESATLEEVTVLGSRIKRKDFVSNAPVATLGVEQIELTGTVNAESLLNTLPQAVPGLDRSSNNPGGGIATVDLRGLGENRTLVLINGSRALPATAGGVVDINTIPTALIKNVEVLTGGASALYGSDAVAGVVNFTLKDDFEGVELSTSYEETENGDAGIFNASFTFGGNFADDRGNVVINVSYTDREELFQGDRGFSSVALDDSANGLIPGGSPGVPATAILESGFGSDDGAIFNQDGSVRPFIGEGADNDFYNFAPVNYLQLPQERFQGTALGTFKVNDKTEVYGRIMFNDSSVPQQLAATPIFQTSTFTLDGNPFLTPEAQQTISDVLGDDADTDGDGIADTATGFLARRLLEVGPRVSNDTFQSYQFQIGIRGDIGSGWTYDIYGQQGTVTNTLSQLGNVNRARYNQALLLDLEADPTGGTCLDTSANGSTVNCSPINIFGEGNISAEGAAFLNTAVSAVSEYEQKVFAGTFTGPLFSLPAGEVQLATGFEHIANDFSFRPSQDLAAGTIAGFNGSPATSGDFRADSIFGELYIPVVEGLPFVKLIDLELAYRTSDYTTVGEVSSYKISGSWAFNDELRFRAGFNTAVRAPSISELFAPQGEGFPGTEDPCSANATQAITPEIAAICVATGVPAAAVGTGTLNAPAGQIRELNGGNPELSEEEAETITAGFVWTPSYVDGLTVSIDYFDIEIEDAIASFGGGANNVLNTCYYDTDEGGVGGAGSPFCDVINRRSNGSIDFVSVSQQNVAETTLSGIDLAASYQTDLAGGLLNINYLGTYTKENDFVAFEGSDPIECAGNFGLDCDDPIASYKHRVTFGWSYGSFNTQLLWRYIGSVDDDNDDVEFVVEKIDAESYFDIVGSYSFNEHYTVTFGIDNLLDTDPPLLGDNQEQANTYPATYDVYGRNFYVAAKARF